VYEYVLKRQTCPCPVYLPNAFSPNADGHDDLLEMFSNCNVKEIHHERDTTAGRSGISRAVARNPAGMEPFGKVPCRSWHDLVAVRYVLINESGEKQEGTLLQNVAFIRANSRLFGLVLP